VVVLSEGNEVMVRRGARSRSRLIVPVRSGNSPQRTRRREAADRMMELAEGQMARDLDREVISTTTTQDSGAGSEGAEADPDDAGAPHRRGVDARSLAANPQGRGGGCGRGDGGALRGRAGGEPVGACSRRFKSGRYRAPAVRRVHLEKPGTSKTRPIGIPTLEDKISSARC